MAVASEAKTMAMSLRVVVPPHPLIGHWLTVLRQRDTPPAIYASAFHELGKWLTYEALRDWLPHQQQCIESEQGPTEGTVIAQGIPLINLPLLPTALDLWQGARGLVPNAILCLDGVPNQIEANAGVLVFIDQITDGKRLQSVLDQLRKRGLQGKRLRVICAVASNPGLKALGEACPDLTIYTACIDSDLTESGLINPGIGDPMQRLDFRS